MRQKLHTLTANPALLLMALLAIITLAAAMLGMWVSNVPTS